MRDFILRVRLANGTLTNIVINTYSKISAARIANLQYDIEVILEIF